MRFLPCTLYRARTPDGNGGWSPVLTGGATVYGAVTWYEFNAAFACAGREDVRVEDVISVAGKLYRVTATRGHEGAPVREYTIEAMERPYASDEVTTTVAATTTAGATTTGA